MAGSLPGRPGDADQPLLFQSLSLEDFEMESLIGRGQFSTVYRAKCKETGATVALKKVNTLDMLDNKARLDCMKEIKLLQHVSHVNVVQYLGSRMLRGELVIVLELAGAGDLARMLHCFRRRRRLLPEPAVWKYFVQVCAGLAHMHSKRVMHRDIKPANIFVTAEGVVKLGDLGLGRYFSIETVAAHSLVGTPYYMSPERIHESGYTFSSDVWSVGCLLYEMAALQSPFYGEQINLYSLCKRIENCEYAPLPSGIYSDQMRSLIKECVSADPASRPGMERVYRVAQKMHRRGALQHHTSNTSSNSLSDHREPPANTAASTP